MFDFTEGQERIFVIFDNIIDSNECVWDSIQSNESLRKRINRNFTSIDGLTRTESAMYLYGFNFHTYEPTELELKRCLYFDDDGVHINCERFNELVAISNIGRDDLMDLIEPFRDEVHLEFLDKVILNMCPSEVTIQRLQETVKNFRSLVEWRLGWTYTYFRELFQLDNEVTLYHSGLYDPKPFFDLGIEFEYLVTENLFFNYERQAFLNGFRPDFSLGGDWIDVKLRKGTAIRDGSVRRYSRVAEKLTFVYALDDNTDTSYYEARYGAKFKHISEFYGDLDGEAIAEMERISRKASDLIEASP